MRILTTLNKKIKNIPFKFGLPLFHKINRLSLPTVTLIIVDCVDYKRAKRALDHCRFYCDFAEVKLLTHFDVKDKYVTKIQQLSSIQAYSEFMIKNLSDHINTGHVLVAQWDGFVLNSQFWNADFLKYDYIGAPWPVHLIKPNLQKSYQVGNGGFSLRSKKLQDFLSQDDSIQVTDGEDVVICQYQRSKLEQAGFTFAPVELAAQFSCEIELIKTFGQHGRVGLHMPLRPFWIRFYNLIYHGRFVN